MDQQARMMKQMMDLQKATLDGMLNNMIMFWNQTEKMVGALLEQAVWLPEDGRKVFREWADTNRKGCESFKNTVDDGFRRMETCFAGDQHQQAPQT